MTTEIKETAIGQFLDLLKEQGEDPNDYELKDAGGPYILIIKKDGLKLMMSTYGFDVTDITDNSDSWNYHKMSILKMLNKLDKIYKEIINDDQLDKVVDLMCSIDTYLNKSILDHFSGEKGGVKVTNPTMFSNMGIYMLTFKNLEVLKRFAESKLFYKVTNII